MNPFENMKDKPFEHDGPNGSKLVASHCDFRNGVTMISPHWLATQDRALVMEDVAACIGYHACNILPHLNGFRGYDAISFTVEAENI